MQSRVFVTGLGVISAIGNGTGETLNAIQNLKSGIGALTLFDSVHRDTPVAQVGYLREELARLAEVDDETVPHTRNTLLALIAAQEAMAASGWEQKNIIHSGMIDWIIPQIV